MFPKWEIFSPNSCVLDKYLYSLVLATIKKWGGFVPPTSYGGAAHDKNVRCYADGRTLCRQEADIIMRKHKEVKHAQNGKLCAGLQVRPRLHANVKPSVIECIQMSQGYVRLASFRMICYNRIVPSPSPTETVVYYICDAFKTPN